MQSRSIASAKSPPFRVDGFKCSAISWCQYISSSSEERENINIATFFPEHHIAMFSRALGVAALALCARVANAAFGLTTNSGSYVVDAGSSNPLKFTVSRTSCDITSIVYYGSELQYQSTGSHIGSGLGSATVSATQSGKFALPSSMIVREN